MTDQRSWWQDGVIYQIYPRSFADSNGDGIGDLEGIRGHLDHLAWLGVDAIWLSPCFPSPMKDFGYDVADYCDIGPEFGTLADFDRLVADAKQSDIRIVLDLVPNHTSDQHPWFLESRTSRTSARRDWYTWRDPAPDGGPPNNWKSVFGGPAWTFDPETEQYYLHSFLAEQPDLNWRNPDVPRAIHDVMRFWFERGVAGFRIDVIHKILKDPELRNNVRPKEGRPGQRHDENHPDVHDALRELRRVTDVYPERMLVGEVFVMNPEVVAQYYGATNDELHLAFNFSFMSAPFEAPKLRAPIEQLEALLNADASPTLVLSSHDAPRHASRYDHPELGDARARLAALLLLTLRGTPFIYYGEEIGMRNVEIPADRVQDPVAHTLDPKFGRDPERSPMQWSDGPGGGFGSDDPWLPMGEDVATRNVEAQRRDPTSLLCLYRDLIALRRRTPALHRGTYSGLSEPDAPVWAFERTQDDRRVRVAVNFDDCPHTVDLGPEGAAEGLRTTPGRALPEDLSGFELDPCEGIVVVLA